MRALKIYFKSIRINIMSQAQYRGWYFMILQVFLIVILDPISTVLMFSRFGNIGEWSVYKIMLIYSLAVTGYGLAETFARGFDYFPWKMIQSGDFDRLLLRPCPLTLQAACSYFHLHRAARPVSGLMVIFYCLSKLGTVLDTGKILILAGALLGGAITYAGVYVMTSGIAFFTVKALDWIYIVTNASYQVTRCPIDYTPKLLKNAFTFVVPMLVVSYYPASVICGWGEPFWKGVLALPAAVLFFAVSFVMWKTGVKRYRSTGS
ncbi:MAG: ABC-2 family transporter protein [Clostridiales bacterium]|jgi:ABC-2 type transport system permease protein|nr:ABC-2 family transporter protein [Clostridiales bacterium]